MAARKTKKKDASRLAAIKSGVEVTPPKEPYELAPGVVITDPLHRLGAVAAVSRFMDTQTVQPATLTDALECLEAFAGDAWPQVFELLRDEPIPVALAVVQDISEHFRR
ncbi:hypothetical protein D1O33_00460 [Rhodococcus rhodochrous]|uniref:hypothetical protein n=1 Tax=Rhodococcus rhodochrous TaxID=1829 RepID=UPI00132F2A66|nr:hypothetical protein [Rhodococcus rhodochrous]QHG80574.1 hypothetical protein D1O33_00460 [Rhodococcus rhodochrous]